MNANALKALFRDAIYQVFDNWVFRILFVLGAAVVLCTFIVGFREDEIELLFGFRTVRYDVLFGFFGGSADIQDPQGVAIDVLLSSILDVVGGFIGVIFCIAATAFFVPDLIKKGAADVLLHKPLGRLTFYLARYAAGLMFVAVLATAMMGGVYAGLAIVSRHHDPGILIGALSLTYLFGLIYAVSMFVGVLTRSTVAAILVTIIFFFFNGCVHLTWKEFQKKDLQALEQLDQTTDDNGGDEEPSPESEEDSDFWWLVEAINSPLHYALPKTGDAELIARKLRRAVNPAVFVEDGSLVALFELPKGMERVADPSASLPAGVAKLLGELRFALRSTDPTDRVTYSVHRRSLGTREVTRRGKTELVKNTVSRSAASLRDALELDSTVSDVESARAAFGAHSRARAAAATSLRWKTTAAGAARAGLAIVFRGAKGELLYTVWVEDSAALPSDERIKANFTRIDKVMGLDRRGTSYYENFTLTAPWRMNILFSIGSSIAFVLIMLALGWWRLARIEF